MFSFSTEGNFLTSHSVVGTGKNKRTRLIMGLIWDVRGTVRHSNGSRLPGLRRLFPLPFPYDKGT